MCWPHIKLRQRRLSVRVEPEICQSSRDIPGSKLRRQRNTTEIRTTSVKNTPGVCSNYAMSTELLGDSDMPIASGNGV